MNRHIGRIFLVMFVVSILLLFIVVKLFGGNHKPAPKSNVPVVLPLPKYSATNAAVIYTLDGPITGDDTHRAIRITVDQYLRTLDIIGGYNGNIIEEKTFANNQTAYNVFLHALNNSGFLTKVKNPKVTDPTGQCPLGQRFIFDLNDGGVLLSHSWTTSCGGSLGTLGVHPTTLQQLFQNQITNYNQIISQANVDVGY